MNQDIIKEIIFLIVEKHVIKELNIVNGKLRKLVTCYQRVETKCSNEYEQQQAVTTTILHEEDEILTIEANAIGENFTYDPPSFTDEQELNQVLLHDKVETPHKKRKSAEEDSNGDGVQFVKVLHSSKFKLQFDSTLFWNDQKKKTMQCYFLVNC